ncbi:unnamed protein product [Mycena citricolor]|uniref:Uncharacterized protein n=1 Tax=Mycena citricolor TaxID=2018698 RepID=A0AAD2GWN7_9AGAR|nr:unnamed protein product [Mycena citricolor]
METNAASFVDAVSHEDVLRKRLKTSVDDTTVKKQEDPQVKKQEDSQGKRRIKRCGAVTAPKVPATGMINNAEYDGWDAMLALLRQREQDKAEQKMMERLGAKSGSSSSKTKFTSSEVGERWTGGNASVMEIEYDKPGSVREWDLGKDLSF